MMCSSETRHRYYISPNHLFRILLIIVLAVSSSSGVLFYLFEIDFINYLPTISLCPFHAITGLECPGCGMTRAMISLGQLKLGAAIGYNLFSIPLLMLMIFYMWPGKFPSFLQHQVFSLFVFIIVIVVWLMRLSGVQSI